MAGKGLKLLLPGRKVDGLGNPATRGGDDIGTGTVNTGLIGDGQSFAGHGGIGINSDGTLPTTIVPEGTSLTIPVGHNRGLNDTAGQLIESGDVTGGMQLQNRLNNATDGSRTYLPGSEVPNYVLTEPDNPFFVNPVHPLQNSITVTKPTPLSDLLQPNMGCVNWAACTYEQ